MKHIHMIGIKGSGMSALACILHDNGYYVTGSDTEETLFTETSLRERGIPLYPFSAANIQPEQQVIVGNAFPDTHEEVVAAYQNASSVSRYHHFLGEWLQQTVSIAISGAHGKTSTTGLMSKVFAHARPTSYLIGDGTGKGAEGTSHFVFESCEYRRHFHAYHPDYAIVTNVDFDHPDYFTSLDDVQEAFQTFAYQTKKALIVCGDDSHAASLKAHVPVYTYGLGTHNRVQAADIRVAKQLTTFDLVVDGETKGTFSVPLVGTHHIQNTLAVLTVSLLEGLPLPLIQEALFSYRGVKRRFQLKADGEYVVIDDYAHHPTEINATLETARLSYPDRRIVAIFQPHTFTRTATFLGDFAASLQKADAVYLCPIFGSARESKGTLSIEDLQARIEGSHLLAEHAVHVLHGEENAVLLFMGAGDITKYEEAFLDTLPSSASSVHS